VGGGRGKSGLVDSKLDSQSKGHGFESRFMKHYMAMVSKAMPGCIIYPILVYLRKERKI